MWCDWKPGTTCDFVLVVSACRCSVMIRRHSRFSHLSLPFPGRESDGFGRGRGGGGDQWGHRVQGTIRMRTLCARCVLYVRSDLSQRCPFLTSGDDPMIATVWLPVIRRWEIMCRVTCLGSDSLSRTARADYARLTPKWPPSPQRWACWACPG